MDLLSTVPRSGLLLAAVVGLAMPRPAGARPIFTDTQVQALTFQGTAVGGDFDRDGIPDVVLVTCTGCPGGAFLKGTGQGDFTVFPLDTDDLQGAPRAADLNGDGALDLVFTQGAPQPSQPYPEGWLGVSLGTGVGSFQPPRYYDAYATQYTRPVIADLNGDGRMDVATVTRRPEISVFLGQGDGTLRPIAGPHAPGDVAALAAGDLDGDGRDDLLAAVPGAGVVSIFLGRNDGGFAPGGSLPAAGSALLVVDLDDDGILDIVASDHSGPAQDLLAFTNDGRGGFGPPRRIPLGRSVAEMVAGDLNGDRRADLLVAAWGEAVESDFGVDVLLGRADGDFDRGQQIRVGGPGPGISCLDFDLDGRKDLVSVSSRSGNVVVLFGMGDGTLLSGNQVEDGSRPGVVAASDINGDGLPDLAVGNLGTRDLSIVIGQGSGGFATLPRVPLGEPPAGLAVADLNEDGMQDVVVSTRVSFNPPRGSLFFLAGNGDGSFDAPVLVDALIPGGPVVAIDFNEDGHLDLLHGQGLGLRMLPGRGDGTFGAREFVADFSAAITSVAPADFNADGHADLAVCAYPYVQVRLGDGQGGASRAPFPDPTVKCKAVATGDFDLDGHVDLGIAESFGNVRFDGRGVAVYSGAGDGTFSFTWNAGIVAGGSGAAVADFDADGIDDLAVSGGDSIVGVLLSRGDRTFEPLLSFGTDLHPVALAAADFNRDGRPDLVTASDFVPGRLSILANHGPQPDADGDGILNRFDSCTDLDGDGLGDRGFRSNTCPVDICPGVFDPAQPDRDADGIGDACDPCPDDPLNDFDADGLCGDVDLCPGHPDPRRFDADDDGVPDACDNCRRAANADQSDGNDDGSGDACQPSVDIVSIRGGHGGPSDTVDVTVVMGDPQGDTLRTRIEITAGPRELFVTNFINGPYTCDQGYSLGGQGRGFIYVYSDGLPTLYDLDSALSAILGLVCDDARPDYWFARVPCAAVGTGVYFEPAGDLRQALADHSSICMRPFQTYEGGYDVVPLSAGADGLHATIARPGPDAEADFPLGLPTAFDIGSLESDRDFTLTLTVDDGTSVPASASHPFRRGGEQFMVFNAPPHAVASAPGTAECATAGGAAVMLDGSASSDADSTPGTNDAILAFAWYEDRGAPTERLLGEGETIAVTLALGTHALSLGVLDNEGNTDTTDFTVTVVDTTPPAIGCPASPGAECTGADGAQVSLAATAQDACGAATITNDHTDGGADASGSYPPGTTSVGFIATDAAGLQATCTAAVTVRDTVAPTFTLHTDPGALWPPNHELMPVRVWWETEDGCDPAVGVQLISVASSEPDDGRGAADGTTSGDVGGADVGAPDTEMLLRAERDGGGAGRIYTLTYRATDRGGNLTPALATVFVPHDLGHGPEPLLMRLESGAGPASARLFWPSVPEAIGYDVISGTLGSWRVHGGRLDPGPVRVLARSTTATSLDEPASTPVAGQGFFYLIQQRTTNGPAGYGTESVLWPRIPAVCEGGCP